MCGVINPLMLRSKGVLATAVVLALLGSCAGHPLTDETLITIFEQNKKVFYAVAQDSFSSKPVCPHPQDPYLCDPKGSSELIARLKRELHLEIKEIYIDRKRYESLWIPVETYGYLSMSSSTRGYVFCRHQLTPVTNNTLAVDAQGYSFRPIGDGWMLYVAN